MAHDPVGYGSVRKQTTEVKVSTAPVGGWNMRDSLANMPPTDAFVLDNWFPKPDGVQTRNGCTSWATGVGAPVKTVMTYEGGTNAKLLACGGGKVFDATSQGAVGAAITTGLLGDVYVSTMFANSATQFLCFVNGQDTGMFTFDNTSIVKRVITGGSSLFTYVHSFKQRIFLAGTNECAFYYLPTSAIAGAATRFDLSEQSFTGGYLLAIHSISRDAGNGPNDYIAFILSTGEIIVYNGTDPSNAATWALVGRYRTPGKPIGRRCVIKYGADILIVTEIGLIPLMEMANGSFYDNETSSIAYKVGNAFKPYIQFAALDGWQSCIYGKGDMLLFNLPLTSNGLYQQFVMNTVTGAWSRFVGWNALSMAVAGTSLYFGDANGNVMLADSGTTDNGIPIAAECKQAFSYYNEPERKQFLDARLLFQYTSTPAPVIVGFNVDFRDDANSYSVTGIPANALPIWDVAAWDVSAWAQDSYTSAYWMEINKTGFSGSVWFRTSSTGPAIKWFATELMIKVGGPV